MGRPETIKKTTMLKSSHDDNIWWAERGTQLVLSSWRHTDTTIGSSKRVAGRAGRTRKARRDAGQSRGRIARHRRARGSGLALVRFQEIPDVGEHAGRFLLIARVLASA